MGIAVGKPPARRTAGGLRWRQVATAGAVLVVATSLAGCFDSGPSTKQELCASYSVLGTEVLSPHFSDNVIFRDAGALASVASRYNADPAVMSSAPALKAIANSSSTSVGDLMNATTSIEAVCGHPLGIG
jgi:hypothetical protein